jgi:hypothetical protein
MTQILLGPVLTDAPTVKITNKKDKKTYWRKQILPEGKYNYKGDELDLTADTHRQLIAAFNDKAFDEVPFQFGPEHNNDTFRRGGTMVDVQYVPGEGTYGYFDFSTSPEAAKYVTDYPKFGVSPRIVIDHERMDGKTFPAALQHICGTVVPRATGMSAWEKVELSEADEFDDAEMIDFSDESIKGTVVGTGVVTKSKSKSKSENEGGKTVELTQAQLDYITQKMKDDEEIEKLFAGVTEQQQTPPPPAVPKEVTLSLSNHDKEIAALKAANVRAEWQARKIHLASQGVPPAVLDLAEPLMTSPDSRVIDLSTAEGNVQISDKVQMLSVLEALKGTVDLGEEQGHSVGGDEPSEQSFTDKQIDSFLTEYGIK